MKKNETRQFIALCLAFTLIIAALAACSDSGGTPEVSVGAVQANTGAEPGAGSSTADAAVSETPAAANTQASAPASDFNTNREITVVSREDGSGTRGAFIELFGVQVRDADGNRVDMTTQEAIIINSTNVVLTTVAEDPYAIGYCSIGSLNDTVKALAIDGSAATSANVLHGSYTISRPFNIATQGDKSDATADFITFIMSKEGQDIAAASYVPVDTSAASFESAKPSGKVVVAGSSSVAPLMEKLIEGYAVINPAVTIELQISDSSAGMNAAIEGTCDIGMASRELSENEENALEHMAIALDGVAIIVNPDNPFDNASKEEVRRIFTGEVTEWNEVIN